MLMWSIFCLTVALTLHSSPAYGASTWVKRQVNEPTAESSQTYYVQPMTKEEFLLLADRTKTALEKESSPAEFAEIVVDFLKQNVYNASEDILTNPVRSALLDRYQVALEENVKNNSSERARVAADVVKTIDWKLARIEAEDKRREEYEVFAKEIKADLLKRPFFAEQIELFEKYYRKYPNELPGSFKYVNDELTWEKNLLRHHISPDIFSEYLIEKIDEKLAEYKEVDKQIRIINKKE